jgi:hypothetical protein
MLDYIDQNTWLNMLHMLLCYKYPWHQEYLHNQLVVMPITHHHDIQLRTKGEYKRAACIQCVMQDPICQLVIVVELIRRNDMLQHHAMDSLNFDQNLTIHILLTC